MGSCRVFGFGAAQQEATFRFGLFRVLFSSACAPEQKRHTLTCCLFCLWRREQRGGHVSSALEVVGQEWQRAPRTLAESGDFVSHCGHCQRCVTSRSKVSGYFASGATNTCSQSAGDAYAGCDATIVWENNDIMKVATSR